MMLLLVAMCWGLSYFSMDLCLESMGPFTLNTYRFLGAFVLLCIISFKRLTSVNRTTMWYAFLAGTSLTTVYIGATFGVLYTTLSNCAFLCATTVVFSTLIEVFFFKRKLGYRTIIAVIICFAGIALLTLKEDFSINMGNLKGDLFALACGFTYAVEILLTDIGVKKEEVDAYQLGVFSLGVCGAWMLILSLIFETMSLPDTRPQWAALIFLAIFCTGLSFVIQPVAQQYTVPSHVTIIFALEPVFAGISAFFLVNEVPTARAFLGEILMIFSLIYIEVDPASLFKKKKSET